LLEELTVRQNLYYNAKLCLDNNTEEQINKVVDQVLHDLDLYEIKDLKVGKPLNKVISGGQRKRVNIALELIREPSVLFVDEPTSGLSSVDSEMVMNLLREQVFKGKLVIVNIHQPSSNLYKMFDRIIFMDKGGYQIFYGNPSEAVVYFKTKSNHANANEDQCPKCGNIDPDQVLQIIEAKIVNEYGKLSRTRKTSPKEWANLFNSTREVSPKENLEKERLPDNQYSIPGFLKQIRIFFTRDILSKLTNAQYVLITLLEAPLLAVIMSFFTKYFSGTSENPEAYVFKNNENLPAYLLMSVIVFLFLGLTISSEEIIKDRKIIQRESFLNLSRGSYLDSKILIMFAISAYQALAYVLIGNMIFEIKGMLLSYWLILFTTSCFANMLGLNISAGLNSVITIYILVPFLLIPQILFCGVLVKYDKLHKSLTNYEYVPLLGDAMASRWAYEALAVEQFKDNKFEKEYFAIEQPKSDAEYLQNFLVPELTNKLNVLQQKIREGTDLKQIMEQQRTFRSQLAEMEKLVPYFHDVEPDMNTIESFNAVTIDSIRAYFKKVTDRSQDLVGYYSKEKSQVDSTLNNQLGLAAYQAFSDEYENTSLKQLVLNMNDSDNIIEKDGRLIRKYRPAYMTPTSRFGRAQLYASVKRLGNLEIDTMWFNIMVIWINVLAFYVVLYYDLLRKLITFFENMRLSRNSTA